MRAASGYLDGATGGAEGRGQPTEVRDQRTEGPSAQTQAQAQTRTQPKTQTQTQTKTQARAGGRSV